MITLKDIIDLKPYCRVCIHNHKELDFVDLYKNPDKYVVSDMNVVGNRLDVLVNPINEELSWKYCDNGFVKLTINGEEE